METSSLALRFSLVFALFLFGRGAQASSANEDMLLFRLQNRSVFYHDLRPYIAHIATFRCLFDNPKLFELSGVKLENYKELNSWSLDDRLHNKRPLVLKLMENLKIQIYANNQRLSVERRVFRSLPLEKCQLAEFDTWEAEVRSLVQAELYLRGQEIDPKVFLKTVDEQVESEILF